MIDMCKAWDDWKIYNYELGKSEGLEIGIKKGIEQSMVRNLRNVIKNFGVNLEQALQVLMVPEEEWNKYRERV